MRDHDSSNVINRYYQIQKGDGQFMSSNTSKGRGSKGYNDDVWYNNYYQLGNRLVFLVNLRRKGYNVKLVLLNIVEDPTHIMTTEKQWQDHWFSFYLISYQYLIEGVSLHKLLYQLRLHHFSSFNFNLCKRKYFIKLEFPVESL